MNSDAKAISADGKVVVGMAVHGNFGLVGYAWRPETGMVPLDQNLLLRTHGDAEAVNADGSVIVGSRGKHAFRWTRDSGFVALEENSETVTSAEAVSADGNVVVGVASSNACPDQQLRCGFRWTSKDGLVPLPGKSLFGATAVTADGQYVFGDEKVNGQFQIVRWGPNGQVRHFSNPPSAESFFIAAVTPDGKFGAGSIFLKNGHVRAAVWNFSTDDIEVLAGPPESKAHGISADGKVVVGEAGGIAFRWTRETGMQTLSDWVAAAGGERATSPPRIAHGVSADGSKVVGLLANGNAFFAYVPRH